MSVIELLHEISSVLFREFRVLRVPFLITMEGVDNTEQAEHGTHGVTK
jgi:hypothetical protein